MKELFKKLILPPPGPVLSLGLIGLMILSGFLYYKSVRLQRYLEPALAMTQPGSEFDQAVRNLIQEEFGPEGISTVRYALGTIFVHESAFMSRERNSQRPAVYEKLGRVFMGILDEPKLRKDVKVILVSTMVRISNDPILRKYNKDAMHSMQDVSEGILNGIYAVEPELETKYEAYFEPTAMPITDKEKDTSWVAFRIIPSETLHIEVLQKLDKYMD